MSAGDTQPPPRVLLVSPPWTSLNEPSLGLSILSAVLDKAAIPCRVHHLNLFALDWLRAETYAAIARVYALNDFVFSGLLDPEVTPRQLRLLREKCSELVGLGAIDHRKYGGIPGIVEQIVRLRCEVVPKWVEAQVTRMLSCQPTLVGFTCMFDQTIASAAISSRVKALAPRVLVAFGGYAVRSPVGEMLLESFDWLDAVCTGEGEPCIGALARASTEAAPDLSRVPNLLYRNETGRIVAGPRAMPVDMDTVPAPNFDDFYADVRQLRIESRIDIAVDRLPVENSRGCWWGAVHHCTFCGIHDDDLAYRSRSAESVLHTLDHLSRRYDCREFRFSDYILPYKYYTTLLPELVRRGAPYTLKCELKANLTEQRVELLRDAGFVEVQPGIESFCSSVLRSMDKGVSGIQNVYLLLLARRYGIVILYNILYGLPDDDPTAIEAMARALPNLIHLDPPATRGRIQITRYAPLQSDPKRFGFGPLRHEHSYDLIFSDAFLSRTGFDLDRYCYMYELPFEPSPRLSRAYRQIERACDEWTAADRERDIDLIYDFDGVADTVVHDSRRLPHQVHILDADQSALLRAADSPCTLASLKLACSNMSPGVFDPSLDRLRTLGLVFEDGGKLVALALPRQYIAARRHWWNNYRTRWQRLPSDAPQTQDELQCNMFS
jgi:ribosomal peptide maturation radical SAM protein 1